MWWYGHGFTRGDKRMNVLGLLKEYCDDHYNNFGYYPSEFEYNGKLYKIILPNFNLEEIKENVWYW